jgi:hypothetical protein
LLTRSRQREQTSHILEVGIKNVEAEVTFVPSIAMPYSLYQHNITYVKPEFIESVGRAIDVSGMEVLLIVLECLLDGANAQAGWRSVHLQTVQVCLRRQSSQVGLRREVCATVSDMLLLRSFAVVVCFDCP